MKIVIIAGARPNFIKIAPIIEAIKQAKAAGKNMEYVLVHTGQHYDKKMSQSFFEQLNIPEPDINLGAGGGSQAQQTANIMTSFEAYLTSNPADLVIVVGDVTSTLACSIVAKKLNTKVAHVEAGIRSGDLSMPEEINRMVTDSITDYFFTTSVFANENLKKLGFDDSVIFFVGNTMIDTFWRHARHLIKPSFWDDFGLIDGGYFVITLHRPANVDEPLKLRELLNEIIINARGKPIVFPVHPRTAKMLDRLELNAPELHFVEPLAYLEFNYLVKHAKAVITDSGGITEETTVMGIPCLTLRDNTERPETCITGTNELVGTNPKSIKPYMEMLFAGNWKKGSIPEKWDGHTSERIIAHLCDLYKL